jgi:hypothetical protein
LREHKMVAQSRLPYVLISPCRQRYWLTPTTTTVVLS